MRREREEGRADVRVAANTEVVQPTRYRELNAVLHELVTSSREILVENLCGAYLQGSFALGMPTNTAMSTS
jgi:hypothetical protein